MSYILVYAIKSAIVLTLLLLPGIFLMFREKMFRFNRMTLLAILVQSLVLPLCNLSFLSMDRVPVVQNIEIGLLEAGFPMEIGTYEEVTMQSQFPWFYVVSILYAIGVAVVVGIRLREILSMGRVIRQGSIWQKREADGIRIFCHADNVAPFSWLRSIVIGEQDYHDSGREIILHEKAHILHRHSLDILLLTLVEALQWWNPFVYLLGIYLRDVHEYQADDYVLRQGISCHAYSQLIIKKAVGASSYTFANSFNHSLTKKRITMMLNPNSSPWMRSRVLYVIPVAALALCAFATPEFKNASNLIEEAVQTEDKGTAFNANQQTNGQENAPKAVVNVKIGADGIISCSTNGSEEERITSTQLMELMRQHRDESTILNITSDKEMSAVEGFVKDAARQTGNLKINFEESSNPARGGEESLYIVDGKELSAEDFALLKPSDIKSVVVLKSEAAMAKFGEKGKNGVYVVETNRQQDSILDKAEVLPKYGESGDDIWKFVMQNVRYPKVAMDCGVTGRIIVGFVVEKDGMVSNVKIAKSVDKPEDVREVEGESAAVTVTSYKTKEGDVQYLSEAEWNSSKKALEEECIRIVNLTSGKWAPGKDKGKTVCVGMSLPLTFRLN